MLHVVKANSFMFKLKDNKGTNKDCNQIHFARKLMIINIRRLHGLPVTTAAHCNCQSLSYAIKFLFHYPFL